jgi:hypothetical protein
MQSLASRNTFLKDMYNCMVSTNITWFKLQTQVLVPFEKVLDAIYSRRGNTSKNYLPICYKQTLENI